MVLPSLKAFSSFKSVLSFVVAAERCHRFQRLAKWLQGSAKFFAPEMQPLIRFFKDFIAVYKLGCNLPNAPLTWPH
jgi:tRNA isopentenyl-2-thiomethyl-A-37 hydroxylase MiaE